MRSITINLTKKCNLACEHCFLSSSPDVNEVMSVEHIQKSIELFIDYVDQIWFSGGEVSVVLEELKLAISTAAKMSENKKINVDIIMQTNATWATSLEKAEEYLLELTKCGLNGLCISANTIYHFKQFPEEYTNYAYIAGKKNLKIRYLEKYQKEFFANAPRKIGRAVNLSNNLLAKKEMCKNLNQERNYVVDTNGDIYFCSFHIPYKYKMSSIDSIYTNILELEDNFTWTKKIRSGYFLEKCHNFTCSQCVEIIKGEK